jgi:hypothetical protein
LWLLLPAAAVLALTPLAPHWWWPTLLPPRLEAYIRPVDHLGMFEIFPWLAYVPAGACVGHLIAQPRDEHGLRRLHLQCLAVGAVLTASGLALAAMEMPAVAFWTATWSWVLTVTGLMTMAVWAAWAWLRRPAGAATSAPFVLFGRTSLFVYWVHVELAFGVLSYPLHKALPFGWALLGLAGMVALMHVLARWWDGRERGPWVPNDLKAGRG